MATYSLSSLRKEACNGHSVFALSVDGTQVFCFIGWMQHTCDGMPRLNDLCLNFARGFCGLPVDRRQRFHQDSAQVPVTVLMIQRNIARAMMPMHLSAETKAYVVELQGFAALHQHHARALVERAATMDAQGDIYFAWEDRQGAIARQEQRAEAFSRIAGVRGLFDTPCMSDAHAIDYNTVQLEAEQDGADFYDATTGEHIASFRCVEGDFDIEGATIARARFLNAYPEYNMKGEPVMPAKRERMAAFKWPFGAAA